MTSLIQQSAQIESAPGGVRGNKIDQLELEIKALRQQTQSTHASIEQLAAPQSGLGHLGQDGLWAQGASAMILGLAALAGGAALGWLASRALRTRYARGASEFGDSRFYLQDEIVAPARRSAAPGKAPASAVPDVAKAPAPAAPEVATAGVPPLAQGAHPGHSDDFAHSTSVSDSDSVLELFWMGDNADSGEESGVPDGRDESANARADATAPRAGKQRAFDFEAAASEVERVRKSLALKREARSLLPERSSERPDVSEPDVDLDLSDGESESAQLAAAAATVAMGVRLSEEEGGLHIDLELEDEAQPDPVPLEPQSAAIDEDATVAVVRPRQELKDEPQPDPAPLQPQSAPIEEDEDTTVVVVRPMLEPDWVSNKAAASPAPPPLFNRVPRSVALIAVEEDRAAPQWVAEGRPDPAVELELAREFENLGLFDGARELAVEVLEAAGDAATRTQARTMIARLDALDVARRVGDLVDVELEGAPAPQDAEAPRP